MPPQLSVTGKVRDRRRALGWQAHHSFQLGLSKPIEVDDYNYVRSLIDPSQGYVPKINIPSPTMAHFRGGVSWTGFTSTWQRVDAIQSGPLST